MVEHFLFKMRVTASKIHELGNSSPPRGGAAPYVPLLATFMHGVSNILRWTTVLISKIIKCLWL